MVANERKSKRRSAASSTSPPEPVVFFTDANLGRRVVPEALRAAGEEVRFTTKSSHRQHMIAFGCEQRVRNGGSF